MLGIISTVRKRSAPHARTYPIYDAPYLSIRAGGDGGPRRTWGARGGTTQLPGLLVGHYQSSPTYRRGLWRYGPRHRAAPGADTSHLHGGSDAAHRAETTPRAGYARGVGRVLRA